MDSLKRSNCACELCKTVIPSSISQSTSEDEVLQTIVKVAKQASSKNLTKVKSSTSSVDNTSRKYRSISVAPSMDFSSDLCISDMFFLSMYLIHP